jgi:hypothetical protein
MWCFLCCVQDYKGNWWVCPDFGYDVVACPSCEGPPVRCKSHYGLFFRYAVFQWKAGYWAVQRVKGGVWGIALSMQAHNFRVLGLHHNGHSGLR